MILYPDCVQILTISSSKFVDFVYFVHFVAFSFLPDCVSIVFW